MSTWHVDVGVSLILFLSDRTAGTVLVVRSTGTAVLYKVLRYTVLLVPGVYRYALILYLRSVPSQILEFFPISFRTHRTSTSLLSTKKLEIILVKWRHLAKKQSSFFLPMTALSIIPLLILFRLPMNADSRPTPAAPGRISQIIAIYISATRSLIP